jgi:hypothetical protein
MPDPNGWIVVEHHPTGPLPGRDLHDSREAAQRECDDANAAAERAGTQTYYTIAAVIEDPQ